MERYRFRFWSEEKNGWFYFGFETFAMYQDQIEKALTDGLPIYQATGIKDKNGRMIYEGDTVRVEFYNPTSYIEYKVIYDEKSLCFAYTDGIVYDRLSCYDNSERFEVI